MKRSDQLALGLVGLFAIGVAVASAQVITNPPIAIPIGCAYNTTPVTLTNGQAGWVQCTDAGKLQVDASITPSGTQNVNLTQILSAAPSLTNPLWVFPATGATFPVVQSSQYPTGATAITASATGTTAATTATLATGGSVTTHICGFSIRANATAAVTGNATVTGTITGTLNFTQWTAPNASGLGITEMIFTPCVPASAVNTSIAVVSAAPGAGGVVSSTAWGYTK